MQKREDGGESAARGKGPAGALSALISGGGRGNGGNSIPARNAALSSLISPSPQPKMKVGSPGDKYEREADAAARKVMKMPEPRAEGGPPEKKLQPKPVAPSISRMIQAKAEEKKEPPGALQRKSSDEEKDKIVQKQVEKEPELQAAAKEKREPPELQAAAEEKKEPLMRKGEGDSGGTAPAAVESGVNSSKGGGDPLPDPVRSHMEPRFGSDFGDVRVHTGPEAAGMNRALNAQAFTHGNNIYFGAGKYRPNTSAGKSLIAHELTHTIQQTGGASRKVQRAEGTTGAGGNNQDNSGGGGRSAEDLSPEEAVDLDSEPPKINVGNLKLPPFKKNPEHRNALYTSPPQPLFRAANYQRGGPAQSRKWKSKLSESGIKSKLESDPFKMEEERTYMLRAEDKGDKYKRVGSAGNIAGGLKRAFWDRQKRFEEYHVDHIVELQVSGWPRTRWANKLLNMELLNASANESSGRQIKDGIVSSVGTFLEDDEKAGLLPEEHRSVEEIKKNYDITFSGVTGGLSEPEKVSAWTQSDIESGKHVDALKEEGSEIGLYDLSNPQPAAGSPYMPHDFNSEEIIGSETSFLVYLKGFGGPAISFDWEGDKTERQRSSGDEAIYGFNYEQVGFDVNGENVFGEGVVGYLDGHPYKVQREDGLAEIEDQLFRWHIRRVPGAQYAGYLDKPELRDFVYGKLALHGFSPIEVRDLYVDPEKGVVVRGDVLPTVPIIGDLRPQIVFEGDDLRLQVSFASGDFDLPSPFEVDNSTLTLAISSQDGFAIDGQVDFGVTNLGEGHVGAAADTSGGFALEGEFNFDSQLFDPAQVGVTYQDGQFGLSGEIGIPEGKVRGIKSADITVEYSEEVLSAEGTAELDVPGVKSGSLSVTYADDQFSIGGSFELADDIPGIRGGSIEATVTEAAEEEGYEVTATGEAQPDIPGVDTSLSITYENGIVDIYGQAGYERGMLAGTLEVGATNRATDENGEPAGEPQDTFRVYGGGELTLGLTPWLEATAGVRFLENGEIEVSGEIGLPDQVEVFEEKSIDQEIFEMPPLQIPLFAIPLGPTSIGVVAQIKGGADVYATIGPGTLEELRAGVTYNPDHEEDTVVEGTGRFVIPADAGLRLWARAGVGMSVGVASVTGNLELGGSLGLEGSAEAGVDVHWTPNTGIDLRAEGEVSVQPKFIFDVGLVLEASSWVASAEWRKNIASYEYGSDYRFGMRFPIHYQEGEPFDISYEDVEFETPDIDIPQIAEDVGKDII